MKTVTYAPTAYDSTRPRELPRLDESRLSATERAIRRWPLRGRGVQCREFLTGSFAQEAVEQLRELDEKDLARMQEEDERKNNNLVIQWGSLRNPILVVNAIKKVALFFGLVGGGGGIILAFLSADIVDFLFWVTKFWIIPFLSVYYLCATAITRGWVKDKNNTIFDRCTGLVEFTLKGERKRVPFDEFDAYISEGVGPNGIAHYYLRLIHRYSPVQVTNPYSRYEPWEVEGEWERLQRFMDISRPLPDIPMFELPRLSDPVSIEYDRKHGRPPDFWKQQDPEEVYRWSEASREALKRFPWGLTRGEAMRSGWTPSGYGEGEAIWKRWPRKSKDGQRYPVKAEVA